MKWFDSGWFRVLLRLPWVAVLVLLPGCQIGDKSLFTVAGPGWRVQTGQALWRPYRAMPELGGDLVMAAHEDGRYLVEFAKTPLPFVNGQTTRTNWLIRFPPRRMGFMGRGQPPVRFGWLYLPAAIAGQPLPKPLSFERKADGGWRLENTRSGETIEGYISP